MKFEDIKVVFESNNNRWMSSIEVFNYFNDRGYVWTTNSRGLTGHKNIIARDLSERYKNKFEIDKSTRPQKYRLKNVDYNKNNNQKHIDDEISLTSIVEDDSEYLVYNKTDIEDEFILNLENLNFQQHSVPFKGRNKKEDNTKGSVVRKVDYEHRAKLNKIKGDFGEEAVMIMEKSKLTSLGRQDLAKEVEWVSKSIGDGLGYDIESWELFEEEFQKIYIEVKTTTGRIDTPFDITENEISVSKELGDRYYIYRLFGIEKVTSKIDYYIIKGDVEKQFDLVPTSFKAYLKA